MVCTTAKEPSITSSDWTTRSSSIRMLTVPVWVTDGTRTANMITAIGTAT